MLPLGSRFSSNVNALTWAVLDSHVVIVGDVQLLGSYTLVSLPDLESLTIRAQVGSEVDAVFSVGILVGRDTNCGTAPRVDPSWERKHAVVVSEAVASVAREQTKA